MQGGASCDILQPFDKGTVKDNAQPGFYGWTRGTGLA